MVKTRLVPTLMCLGLFLAPLAPASADPALDFPTVNGHFYTQANGYPPGRHDYGYEISDEGGAPFWREFQLRGGVEVLGYPISRRFEWDGFLCQATQRGVLQWDVGRRQMQLANVMDYLGERGRDGWLREKHMVPRRLDDSAEKGLAAPQIERQRLGLLDANKAIKATYYSAPDPTSLYGLPTSEVVDVGPAYAVRLQRTVLYQWKQGVPWAKEGQVTGAFVGDVLKEAGLLPDRALAPEPPPEVDRASPTSRGGARDFAAEGVATWYGRYFHGRLMSNREPYNMYDPTIAASNAYPLGTILRVTNRNTGAYVVVRVTDRGAFRYPIVVDLSYAAFGRLGDHDGGTIPVRVEPVK